VEMNRVMRDLILQTLRIAGGNQLKAARILGLTRAKLRYRLQQLGIEFEEPPA
jgi:two-component system response regulator AtoC